MWPGPAYLGEKREQIDRQNKIHDVPRIRYGTVSILPELHWLVGTYSTYIPPGRTSGTWAWRTTWGWGDQVEHTSDR